MVPRMAGKRSRDEVVAELLEAGRGLSTATVVFHTALAARQGLSPSEEKAIDELMRSGPMTAGELGEKTALAPASVTGLIDRLEAKGFALRVKDPEDGRRVLVKHDPKGLRTFVPLFEDWVRELHGIFARYSVAELETILDFMKVTSEKQLGAAMRLKEGAAPLSLKARRRAPRARRPARA